MVLRMTGGVLRLVPRSWWCGWVLAAVLVFVARVAEGAPRVGDLEEPAVVAEVGQPLPSEGTAQVNRAGTNSSSCTITITMYAVGDEERGLAGLAGK